MTDLKKKQIARNDSYNVVPNSPIILLTFTLRAEKPTVVIGSLKRTCSWRFFRGDAGLSFHGYCAVIACCSTYFYSLVEWSNFE